VIELDLLLDRAEDLPIEPGERLRVARMLSGTPQQLDPAGEP